MRPTGWMAVLTCAGALPLTVCGAGATANLLSNGGFEGALASWETSGVKSRHSIAKGQGRDGGDCLRYEKQAAGPDAAAENTHLDQVVEVQPRTWHVAGAWFKSDGRLRPVIRIASEDYLRQLAVGVSEGGTDWSEARVVFQTGARDKVRVQIFAGSLGEIRQTEPGGSLCDDAYLRPATEEEKREFFRGEAVIVPARELRVIDPRFFGVNTLFMYDDDKALADGKIARRLREMPCRLIRYPGGDVADNYLWKTHRLDDPKWWPAKQGPQTTDTDEFMALCRQAGAEPIFVANLETGFVHGDVDGGVRMAAEWVEHCNRRNDYNVKLWEIGNETYLYNPGKHKRAKVTPEMYADAYLKYSRAMKVVDPSIRTGAIGPTRKEGWWTVVLPRIKDEVDFVVVHEYFKSSWGAPGGRAEAIGRFRDYVRHVVPDRAVPIALTEWNTNKATEGSEFAQAIMVSEMALDYIAGGVDWATFWPLRIGGKDWGTRALLDMETNEPRLRYRAFQLLSSNMGARQIETRLKGAALYAFASRDEAGKEIQAFFVNRSTQDDATELTIRIEGTAPKRASAQALTAPSLDASEAAVAPVAIAAKDGAWTCVLPPHSLTVVRFD